MLVPGPERRCRLRVLDMTGLQDDDADRGPEGMSLWSGTVALAKACIEVSKHQSECLKRGSKRRKGPSGTSAAPQPLGVEVCADLFVNGTSFGVLRDALQTGAPAAGPLRLKCRDFHAEELSVAGTVSLLESLEPAGVRRVDLRFNNLGLAGLCAVLPHLARFTHLLSLKLPYSNVDVDLRAPLESLELAFCYLLPGDLAFLSQSLHAPALRKLDLSGHDFSESLFQPLRCLLEETSASLLHLDLMECRLTDARLEALLPALCRCSRLCCLGLFGNPLSTPGLKTLLRQTVVLPDLRRLEALLPALCRCSRLCCLGLFGNPLSTPGLKTLLRQTVVLPDLRLVVYPYPVDCYSPEPSGIRPGSIRDPPGIRPGSFSGV
ncbi:PREDICTED: leucine-rich repeat-containing protein 14-like [Aptenodytes forsteri]|uniref:leucine-rich repeat-containing protein 14-like n=1 Tax=Aptenodytes forsteri TaxID=9233 RepID=UPI0009057FF6|nr:PREDICTED: leucine-rich repeat-containing protein 14-like [Aptenodytes forsteri]